MSWGTYYKHEGYLSRISKNEIPSKLEECDVDECLVNGILLYVRREGAQCGDHPPRQIPVEFVVAGFQDQAVLGDQRLHRGPDDLPPDRQSGGKSLPSLRRNELFLRSGGALSAARRQGLRLRLGRRSRGLSGGHSHCGSLLFLRSARVDRAHAAAPENAARSGAGGHRATGMTLPAIDIFGRGRVVPAPLLKNTVNSGSGSRRAAGTTPAASRNAGRRAW